MKSRYNLRLQPTKLLSSSTPKLSSPQITKKSNIRRSTTIKSKPNRRHSLRLTTLIKSPTITRETTKNRELSSPSPKWCKVENETIEENTSNNEEDDDYDDLIARHHRLMLEEQKDRKLYERYVRGQRTLRRLQCRRTHTAHLNEATRTRLLRELERERRYTVQDQICTYLADHTIIFRHGCQINSKEPITWSKLEEEIPRQKHTDTIHQLDVMIGNLKKVMRMSKSSISKPRLSVHERRKQRLAAATNPSIESNDTNLLKSNDINSTISSMNTMIQPTATIFRLPIVRFSNELSPTTGSQHLTCIQNVLLQNNSRLVTNEISTPINIRKQFLRSKSTHMNLSESSSSSSSSSTKKRPLEKENCSVVTPTSNHHSHANIVLRATSPMVSIKSSTTFRPYPNTRKHPIHVHSSTTRRQRRLS